LREDPTEERALLDSGQDVRPSRPAEPADIRFVFRAMPIE
jgi:hypothetical protein